jgi:predicted RNA-binding protein
VIYNFLPTEQTWEKAELDGTLFVCQLEPSQVSGKERYCIIILNKRGLDNMIVDMADVTYVEKAEELLILRWINGEEEKVQGVFFHLDKDDTREVNCRLITECWESVTVADNEMMDGEVSSYGEEVFP